MDKQWQTKWLGEVDSTNSEAERRLQESSDGASGTLDVIAARWQSAGRGQGDHRWHSAPGENLTFTVVRRYGPDAMAARDQAAVSWGTALAVVDYLASKGVKARIKLPNDIYVGDKKICGLLIKHRVRSGSLVESIIGIGLNINETAFPADLPNPVSLRMALAETAGKAPEEVPELVLEDELEIFMSFLALRLDLSLSLQEQEHEFNTKLI